MHADRWTSSLQRLSCTMEPITWTEVVAGYDFGLLRAEEVRDWAMAQDFAGEACLRMQALQEEEWAGFEARMWEACAECLGRVPRPGDRLWGSAQDRWRKALLREALEADLTEAALAQAIESIYECGGCPEDMLGLWSRRSPWQGGPEQVNFEALVSFLGRGQGPSPAAA